MVPRRVPPAVGAALLFGVVVCVLFGPVLAGHATFVHGDALSVSLPLQQVLAGGLERGQLPLWSDQIYGGHPIFAEGQGGFAHPLNWLMFGVLPRAFGGGATLYAHGLLHLVLLWIAAFGTFGLCRALGLGGVASVTAGLALACSQDWLVLTGNSAIALASAFVPALLWAVERWWQQPTITRALWLGVGIASVLLAGYPQAAHAAGIFALVTTSLRTDRAFWSAPWRHLSTGALALAVGLGLAAIQLLPTLELVAESVRADGVELVRGGDALQQLRGLLASVGKREAVEPGLGSALVLGFALLALGKERVVIAYAVAVALLFQLALADASPLYRAIQDGFPGLDSFRITHLYATIGLVGIAVLAGFGVQRLKERPAPLLRVIGIAALLGIACWVAADPEVRPIAYAFPAFGILLLLWRGTPHWLPASVLALLLVEIFVMRLPLHRFVDADVASEPPPTARFLQQRHPEERDFKLANVPHFFAYVGFASPSTAGLDRLARMYLSSMDSGSNLLYGIPSIHANLALPLSRRVAVTDRIVADVRGESPREPGARFIDAVGVRYVVAHNSHRNRPYSPELSEVFYDEDFRFFVRENPNVREHIRLVPAAAARFVPDLAAAVAAFGNTGDALVLEAQPEPGATGNAANVTLSGVEVITSSAERHVVRVEAREPAYLVLADAPYVGWVARLDGAPVPLLAANVLGKAVAVPPGSHEIEIAYEPMSFAWGKQISLGTTAGVALLLAGSSLSVRRRA